jgi:hypothetical protein
VGLSVEWLGVALAYRVNKAMIEDLEMLRMFLFIFRPPIYKCIVEQFSEKTK